MRRMAPLLLKPMACGTFGCVYPYRRKKGVVLKVTTDPAEVRIVRTLREIRESPLPAIPSRGERLISRTGTTPEQARALSGFVAYRSSIQRLGPEAWAYLREDVEPVDHDKSSRLLRRYDRALEKFFYSRRDVDVVKFLREYPEMLRIVQTAVFLKVAYDVDIEDVHASQLGRVRASGPLHRQGELVLFDGQVDR
jgi:hypothetical protein